MQISVRKTFSTLRDIGLAVEFFEDYSHPLNSTSGNPHSHDMVEMFYVLKGKGTNRVAGANYPIAPGELGIIHFGQEHDIGDGKLDILNIYLDPQAHPLPPPPPGLAAWLPRFLPLNPGLAHNQNRVVHLRFKPERSARIEWLLKTILREQEEKQAGYWEAMRLHWQAFVIECLRELSESAPPSPANTGDAWLEKVRAHLDAHFRETVQLANLANDHGASKSHLCRCFKEYTGKTIYEYILQRRVEAAMAELFATTEKIISVAHHSGFRDVSFFNRVFRRVAGLTPGQYRKKQNSHRGKR